MPRLGSFSVLASAVSDGTSNMSWATETFAYAEAHDGNSWLGVRKGEHVVPASSGLLIRPDSVPADVSGAGQSGVEFSVPGSTPTAHNALAGAAVGAGAASAAEAKIEHGSLGPTRFYARFDLDTVRGIKQFGEILEHVTRRLGTKVQLTLEVEADSIDGFDDTTQRIVSGIGTTIGTAITTGIAITTRRKK